jgi:predicted phosphoadenosine phosphosulfate sulfurtransferase
VSDSKRGLGIDVLTAARQRIAYVFDEFDRVYVSFSGGKDSTVMFHLVMDEARRRGRSVGVLFVDLEAQYRLTVEHIQEMRDMYKESTEWFWVCLPMVLRNAVSVYEPRWQCWDPTKQGMWVRSLPQDAITDPAYFPFFYAGMEFEDFVHEFGKWYASRGFERSDRIAVHEPTACFIGIRTDESFNRLLKVKVRAHREFYGGRMWMLRQKSTQMEVYSAHPIYDWRTADIWRYHGKTCQPHNRLYDLMHKAGVSIHEQRICQPYGEDQRRGLWMYHVLEPETWAKVVARVNGANSGAEFVQLSGNISGRIKITKPDGHTWESFAMLILESLPDKMADHYKDKIAVFLRWYEARGYSNGIPDEADHESEVAKTKPSWRRICKMLLRNDYFAKGLSFDQTKPEYYTRYKKIMAARRRKWGIF